MARPLAPRCGTTSGHLDAFAVVLHTRPCPTVHGILTYWQFPSHHSTVKATAPSRAVINCCHLRVLRIFFFLQCRTSTRHGRSTTGNCKDCFEDLPGIETQDKNNTHTTKQTQKHPKQTTPTQKPRKARQNNQGDL